jgi:hypothetical protein
MHRPLFRMTAGGVAACGALIIGSALPAAAATSIRSEPAAPTCTIAFTGSCSEDTTVTFAVTTTGVLGITVPASADLGSGAVGTSTGATAIGAVTVTDNRATNPSDWVASVYSSPFVNTVGDVIPADEATYVVGAIGGDPTFGAPPFNPGDVTDNSLPVGITLGGTPVPCVSETGDDGDNSAQWDPTINVAIPANAVIGTYTGVVVHSVT